MSGSSSLPPQLETLVAAKNWAALEQLLDSMDDEPITNPGFPARRPLPSGKICEGRVVWEPPSIPCSDLIRDKYEALRKAILSFTAGDRAKTTAFLDWEIESTLNYRYKLWARSQWVEQMKEGNEEGALFFQGLWRELMFDGGVFYDEGYERMGAIVGGPKADGSFSVELHRPDAPMWGGDLRYRRLMEEQDEKHERHTREHKSREEAKKKQEASRAVTQDGAEEMEEMEWLSSFEPDVKRPIALQPLILQMLDSRKKKQEGRAYSASETQEDKVD